MIVKAFGAVLLVLAVLSGCTSVKPTASAPQDGQIEIASIDVSALQAAANQGDLDAQFALAQAYEVGNLGLPLDQDKAFHWYGKAAHAGYVPAQFFYGAMHASSRGTPLDIPGAIRWYRKAAEQNYPDALYPMGYAYELGLGGLTVDWSQALYWYQKSADAGSVFAYQRLAKAYRNGEFGLTPDEAQALLFDAKTKLNRGEELVSMPVGQQK